MTRISFHRLWFLDQVLAWALLYAAYGMKGVWCQRLMFAATQVLIDAASPASRECARSDLCHPGTMAPSTHAVYSIADWSCSQNRGLSFLYGINIESNIHTVCKDTFMTEHWGIGQTWILLCVRPAALHWLLLPSIMSMWLYCLKAAWPNKEIWRVPSVEPASSPSLWWLFCQPQLHQTPSLKWRHTSKVGNILSV